MRDPEEIAKTNKELRLESKLGISNKSKVKRRKDLSSLKSK